MNNSYLKVLDILSFAKTDLERLWEEAQKDCKRFSFEDRQAYYMLENIIESIDNVIYKLKKLSLPAIEGNLLEDKDSEKFELIRSDTGKSIGYMFSCGDYLEVYDDESREWYHGRVEYMTI